MLITSLMFSSLVTMRSVAQSPTQMPCVGLTISEVPVIVALSPVVG